MPVWRCPECGHMVSVHAEGCIFCGCPIKYVRQKGRPWDRPLPVAGVSQPSAGAASPDLLRKKKARLATPPEVEEESQQPDAVEASPIVGKAQERHRQLWARAITGLFVVFFIISITVSSVSMCDGGKEKTSADADNALASAAEESTSSAEPIAPPEAETFTVDGVSFTMVKVEGGGFTMGATPEQGDDAYESEKPAHAVTITTFSIGKTEVTQALWQAVMGSNPSFHKGDELPVEQVSWNDCQAFIRKLNEKTGRDFRLPTEAEWEYAARGGKANSGYKYAGANELDAVGWYDDNSANASHPVGTKQPNELGLYDMSGNVLEWCQDWAGGYDASAPTDPIGPASGSFRTNRGGSWINKWWNCRVSSRNDIMPDDRVNYLGLRLAL